MTCKKLATLNDAASVKNVSCHKAFFKVKKQVFGFFLRPVAFFYNLHPKRFLACLLVAHFLTNTTLSFS